MLTDPPADQIRTRSDVAAVAAGCRWSRLAIARKLRFARSLRDPRDRTRPYRLLTWQRELLYKLEGWRRPDGRRRFTQLHVWIPKKNGKTSFLAELNLDGLLNDREPQPGCYVVATSANQSEEH